MLRTKIQKDLKSHKIHFFLNIQASTHKSVLFFPTDVRDAAPRFVRPLQDSTAVEGNAGRFECEVAALSEPLITWYRDNEKIPLQIGIKYKMLYDDRTYTLVVNDTNIDDIAKYSVKAQNSYGADVCSANLEVECKYDL